LIRKVGVLLDIDLNYFLKGGTWLTIPFILDNLLGLIRSIFFSRFTSPTIYGQFGFVNAVYSTFDFLTLPGVNTALTETVARGNYGTLTPAAKTRARWGTLATLAMIAISIYYLYMGQTTMSVALILAGCFMPLLAAFQTIQAYLNGRKRFDILSISAILIAVFNTAAIIAALLLKKGLLMLVLVNLSTQFIIYLILFLKTRKETLASPVDLNVTQYGKSLTWAGVISSIALEFDNVLLGLSIGFIDVAIYRIASIIPEAFRSLSKMMVSLTLPKIAEHPTKRVYTSINQKRLTILLIFNFLIVLISILLIPFIVKLLYGKNYLASIPLSQLLMVSLAFSLPSYFFIAALQARKQTRSIYLYNLIYSILQIGCLLILVPQYGTKGVVFSHIISRFGSTIYQWYAVTKI